MHLLIHIFPYDKWLIYIDYIMIYHIKAVWCDTYKNHVEEWTLSDGPWKLQQGSQQGLQTEQALLWFMG